MHIGKKSRSLPLGSRGFESLPHRTSDSEDVTSEVGTQLQQRLQQVIFVHAVIIWMICSVNIMRSTNRTAMTPLLAGQFTRRSWLGWTSVQYDKPPESSHAKSSGSTRKFSPRARNCRYSRKMETRAATVAAACYAASRVRGIPKMISKGSGLSSAGLLNTSSPCGGTGAGWTGRRC